MKNLVTILLVCLPLFSFALKPKPDYIATPEAYKMKYSEYTIENGGVKLNSWYITAVEHRKNKTIFITYGDFGNMSYDLFYANELCKRGYDIILFDYRGFGKSSPFAVDSNQLFYTQYATDMDNVLKFYKNKVGDNQINILSFSMGTAITSLCLAKYKAGTFGKVIFEGFVDSVTKVCNNDRKLKNRPFTAPIPEAEYQESISAMQQYNMLLFIGLQDPVCNIDPATISANKKWTPVTYNGGHLGGVQTMTKDSQGDLYFDKIDAYLSN